MRSISAFFVLLFVHTVAAQAQVVRTWVASTGSDSNPCSRTLPCRNFAAAVAAVDAGGEVIVLDSAGYGPVSISKSLTLLAPEGVHAAIAPTSGAALTVSGTKITIRNLYLKGHGGGVGLLVVGASAIFAENVTADGFETYGILVEADELVMHNCVSRNNYTGLGAGAMTGLVKVHINSCRFENNSSDGVLAGPNSELTIRDSLATSNGGAGFLASSTVHVRMTLMNCQAARNDIGVSVVGTPGVAPTALLYIAYSSAVHNATGLHEGGGEIISQGNNFVQDNGFDVVGVLATQPGT